MSTGGQVDVSKFQAIIDTSNAVTKSVTQLEGSLQVQADKGAALSQAQSDKAAADADVTAKDEALVQAIQAQQQAFRDAAIPGLNVPEPPTPSTP